MLPLLATLALAAPAAAPQCDVAVVGAGPGGAYLAWRLAEAPSSRKVCLFEMGSRAGGRIHSLRKQGPQGDLTVEAGAYRFAVNRTCVPFGADGKWCINTPVTKHLIVSAFKLPYKRYDADGTIWDDKLAKIVDHAGEDAGYLTFVEEAVKRAEATGHAKLHLGHELIRLGRDAASGSHVLHFRNGAKVLAADVVLNLPQMPLLRVLALSSGLSPLGDGAAPPLLSAVTAYPIFKLYVHYTDAWWRNVLGLTSGFFNNTAAYKVTEGASPIAVETCISARQHPAPLQGAYHDAHVRCDGSNDGSGRRQCRGYLQAAYTPDLFATRYYSQWRTARSGDSVTHLDGKRARDAQLLEAVHEALVELHAEPLRAAGALERVRAMRPDSGVLSVWDSPVDGIETGCHCTQELALPGLASRGIPKARLSAEALSPFSLAPRVFVANEAWGQLQCFAEGSLQMAENLAHAFFGLPRPAWIPEGEYQEEVLYNATSTSQSAARLRSLPPLGDLSLRQAQASARA
ncbi:hypothetical protein T492DRAFT_1040923 [Pavlovales sp. CCMP2436]|nr:hypothetical protein T492DRAFT_1040923 [Pavlovales sp. CCMP2436]|mmetsp:Transcript_50274/g.117818  ORF Transcript_50274/g.117818 Transcript_50274/m.117818 type:complete len:516 (+) Transcript_50274:101-1648(+)